MAVWACTRLLIPDSLGRIPFVHKIHGPYEVLKGVPTNIVIDRHGIARYAEAFSFDDLNTILVPLLTENPDAAPASGASAP